MTASSVRTRTYNPLDNDFEISNACKQRPLGKKSQLAAVSTDFAARAAKRDLT
jgi:hypothetical protein